MRLVEEEVAHQLFVQQIASVPDRPTEGNDYWYSGYDYILCRTYEEAEELAQLIGYDVCGTDPYDAIEYGYFDPKADEEMGLGGDATSGWYFVRDNTFWRD